ncbi:flagellar motor switch protein FliN [bacterium]|nr:flagellar motor switch protein FliN [bacterium]
MIENDDNLDNLDENKESSFQENSEDISLDSFSDLTAENDLMKNEDENQEDNNQELEIKDENNLESGDILNEDISSSESKSDIADIFSDISAIANMQDDKSNMSNDADNDLNENDTVTVQPVKFAAFDDSQKVVGDASKNMDNLLDINLRLAVELGRATLPVRKVLELTRGSIVELEKIAGEPVELYANGKLIAYGEVVVIEDNFGLRITSMTEPENRLNELQ